MFYAADRLHARGCQGGLNPQVLDQAPLVAETKPASLNRQYHSRATSENRRELGYLPHVT